MPDCMLSPSATPHPLLLPVTPSSYIQLPTLSPAATSLLQLGHMPQEDYPEALHSIMLAFLSGESDQWAPGKQVKMTKKGMVEV